MNDKYNIYYEKNNRLLELYNYYYQLAEKQEKYIRDKALYFCGKAGMDRTLLGIHPHNATVAYNDGRPWANINYEYVFACNDNLSRMYDGSNIVHNWYSKEHNKIWSEFRS